MVQVSSVVSALAYAGVGAGMGSIGAAVITARSGKGEARAKAADLVATAAGSLADRLNTANLRIEEENRQLRRALMDLTDSVDRLFDHVSPEATSAVRGAVRQAKEVL